MTIEYINDHVLLSLPANWAQQPDWQRRWQTEITDGVTGNEARFALTAEPRRQISWLVTPWTAAQQNLLDDMVMIAKKSGLACAPYWGRSSQLAADVTNVTVSLSLSGTAWANGDRIFLLDDSNPQAPVYNARQISGVAGSVLTISQAVTQTFKAKRLVWPILFGKFTCQDMTAQTGIRGSMLLSVSELEPATNATLGAVIPSGAVGIGVMKVGSTLAVA